MRRVGIGAEEALDWLRRVLVVPVFTAHPTEVARRSVMFKRRRIGEFLAQLDRIPMPEQELARLEELVRAEITSLWQTDEVRSRRPTVYDEIKMGLDYYDVSIFATLPSFIARLPRRCAPCTGWRWRRWSCRRCCVSARGSAAIAMAIRL